MVGMQLGSCLSFPFPFSIGFGTHIPFLPFAWLSVGKSAAASSSDFFVVACVVVKMKEKETGLHSYKNKIAASSCGRLVMPDEQSKREERYNKHPRFATVLLQIRK